jgi:SpoVK/Ycf46/Vps4 family AAA+-type ATPase
MDYKKIPAKKRKVRDYEEPSPVPTKKTRIEYYGDLPEDSYKIKTLKDLIKLGFNYDQETNNNKLFMQLFKIIPCLMKLDKMIGMESIKKEIIEQTIYSLQEFYKNDVEGNMMHTVINGSPGTGKTSVATIIGEIYQNLGFLPSSKITIAKRVDFIAGYVGQTAIKTQALLKKAKGGVLIIDEIYSFGSANDGNRDSFAKEAIDALNQFLSENRKDIICIILGYKNDVENCFFAQNQGLKRRFPFRYEIKDYTPKQLKEIFISQVKNNNWSISQDVDEYLTDFFSTNKELFHNNGGDTEKLFFKCKSVRSFNVFGQILENEIQKYQLTIKDIKEACKEFIKDKESLNENKDKIFGLYT